MPGWEPSQSAAAAASASAWSRVSWWEAEARAMLGRFRLAATRHPDDPGFAELITTLHRDSPQVREWWPRHDVTAIGSGTKKLRHPCHGPLDYTRVVLQVADHPDQTLVTYRPTMA